MPEPNPPRVSPNSSVAFEGTRATPTSPLLTKVAHAKLTDWAEAAPAVTSRIIAALAARHIHALSQFEARS
jgi:hypothetical protein